MDGGRTYGRRRAKADTTTTFCLADICRSYTRWMDCRNKQTSVMMSKAAMSCHRRNYAVRQLEWSKEGPSYYHVFATRSNVAPRLIEFAIDANHENGTDDPDRGEAHDPPRNSTVL